MGRASTRVDSLPRVPAGSRGVPWVPVSSSGFPQRARFHGNPWEPAGTHGRPSIRIVRRHGSSVDPGRRCAPGSCVDMDRASTRVDTLPRVPAGSRGFPWVPVSSRGFPPCAGTHWPLICCRISMMHGIPVAISAACLHALRSEGGLTIPASSLTCTKKIWLPSRKDKCSRSVK